MYEDKLPDTGSGKSYKCHPNTNTNFVICIICEEVFHLGEFKILKNVKFISDVLAMRDIHKNITSNKEGIELNEHTRLLIVEIK